MNSRKKKYDVGILGWWYGMNYGSILTYYGLNRAIEDLGHSVLMVHETLGYNGYRVKWRDSILSVEFARRVGYKYTQQYHYSELPRLNEDVSAFVVGSDQLWNPLIGRVNDDLFLDFVSAENRRIAYGTSFGNRGITKFKPDFVEKHSANLKKFHAISVREAYAVNTAKVVFGVPATQVVDPVFLLPRSDYEALADKAPLKLSGEYLALFILDPSPEKRDVALAVADKLGLQRIVVIPNPDDGRAKAARIFTGNRFEILHQDAPEIFLHAYSNARYVVTDSFHGTAFAVIFNKPFSSIYNIHRGADRFKNLMDFMGFGESRRVLETDTPETIRANPAVSLHLDFSAAEARIEEGRRKSMRWLKSAISAPSGEEGMMETLRNAYEVLMPGREKRQNAEADRIARPSFQTNNEVWSVTQLKSATDLKVAPGGAVRGNLVWCDLPYELLKDGAYRLTVTWKIRTSGGAVNLHIRNSATGKFHVIGTVAVQGRVNKMRTDAVDFVVPQEGFSQFMLGAIHFSGNNGGAEVESISVQEILASSITPGQKSPTYAEVATALSEKDNERFIGALAKSTGSSDVHGARARLMFHAHAIEKGLSHVDFRAGFGKISVPALAKELNSWLAAGRDEKDPFFRIGASVLRAYFDRHKQLKSDVSHFYNLLSAASQTRIAQANGDQGGVLSAEAVREDLAKGMPERSFLDVIYGRRSVRAFTSHPVKDEDIRRAVQIALQAPSVCNRQAARVHLIEDADAIKAAVDIQGGFGGYAMPPRLLLVTADLRAFLFAAERNQPFVDGGLFMMTLLLGLEQVGLGSCCLNTAMNTERENKIRKILDIPDQEVFIAFIAVGHFDPKILTPRSKRLPVDEVLVRHCPK
ncbi:polysaccharide pyruvyl transferase family protein [Cereibacter sphaeroides]|uniref:polysaccharide pyruvyl transferase family protein n=1 Tax=Cereibacter sphaeroides TaxID=1063 RepID=UPI001F372040|nr:polysaccharide pyruvyl transferase family protein [Cereibacter sphaeroides]MCE6967151.1 polysaccharide pyruvyl transferase family protein [Cereibacter sphaeroides]